MRRLANLLGRDRDRERGATFVTVALLLMTIFALMGLGVDGSALYMKRQHVQNGADAAAFAVAQEYALAGCIEDYTLAAEYARYNVPTENATVQADLVQCDGNSVTVVASGEQTPFFSSVLNIDPIRVPADATVEWGSPVAGSAFPLAIAECEFEEALNRAGGFEGAAIEVWVPQDNSAEGGPTYCQGDEYPAGGFGWLESTGCQADYADTMDDTGAWVDGGTGFDSPDCDWAALIGTTVLVPIFDDTNGLNGSSQELHITKFASIRIVTLYVQTSSGGDKYWGDSTKCRWSSRPEPTNHWKKACFHGVFEGYVSIEDNWELGPPDGQTLIIRLKN